MPGRTSRAALLVGLLVAASLVVPGTAQAQRSADRQPPRAVTAEGAVLWDPLDGRVLWGREPRVSRRMASTTKIMTALLALEAGTIDDVVTVSRAAADADSEPGAATLGLRPGEQVSMRALLTALMMRSGNDAAAAIAEHVAGSEGAFVAEMNARARRLGLRRTRFLDATGLSDSSAHHASPVDLSRLAETAMAQPGFAGLVGVFRADVPGFGTLVSRNLLLDTYPGATGVKTGYTSLAGLCLVASARRDGRTLFATVLDSDDSFGDATALLDHGFEAFTVASAADIGRGVYRTAAGEVPLRVVDATARTVPVTGTVRVRTWLRPAVPAQVTPGTRLGRAELVVDGRVVDTAGVVAGDPLPQPTTPSPASAAGNAIEDAVRAFVRSAPRRQALALDG